MMKNLLIRAARQLCKAWLWSLLVVVVLALLIGFFGSTVVIAGHTVWETAASRLLTACFLLLGWGVIMLLTDRRNASAPASSHEKETDSDTFTTTVWRTVT